MMKNFEDFPAFGKQQFNASVASATAFTKGMQTIATEFAEYSKKSFEDSTAVVEKAAAAKSLDKAFEIQSDYAKSAYEGYVGQMTKLGEMYASIAKEAYKPFEGQLADLSGKTASKKAS